MTDCDTVDCDDHGGEVETYNTWPDRSKLSTPEILSSKERMMSMTAVDSKTQPLTMEAALQQLNISYSPATQCLQTDVRRDDQQQQQVVYKPGHRKAYSLPRTLESVDDDGSITGTRLEHDHVLESPRTTLQRYGIAYEPYNFKGEDVTSISEVSGVSGGVSDHSSSHADSGVFSEASDKTRAVRRGLGELFSKAASFKLFSRQSDQKVVSSRHESESGVSGGAVSSHLIMEARPAGVPCKSAEEEEKHRQEHKMIMMRMKKKEESEVRSKAQRQADMRRVEDDLSSLTSHWQTSIIPHWSSQSTTRKTQSLWWRGLPPPVRGRVWRLALDNTLNLTPQLYNILVMRAREQLSSSSSGPALGQEETLELIRLDVSRTFPQLCIFQEGGPYYQLLHNVLSAYVCYRPDIGYVQGMSFIAAILILNLDEADAFIMFANLLNNPLLSAFFTVDQPRMSHYYSLFSSQLSTHLPHLHQHFSNICLKPELYLLDWIMTLFSKCAPLDVACRVWDVMIRDGEMFLFRAGLGVLTMFQEKLLQETDFIMIAQFLSRLPDNINCELLFEKIEVKKLSFSNLMF